MENQENLTTEIQEIEIHAPAVRSFRAARRAKKLIALGALALFMALTIGMTWVFWSGGILAPDPDADAARIPIATGEDVQTQINLGDWAPEAGVRLVPGVVFSGANGTTNSFEGSFTVIWVPTEVGAEITGLEEGVLTLTVSNWELEQYAGDFDNAVSGRATMETSDTTPIALFNAALYVGADAATRTPVVGGEVDITINEPLTIWVVVTMNAPLTPEIRDAVQGDYITFDVGFSIAVAA